MNPVFPRFHADAEICPIVTYTRPREHTRTHPARGVRGACSSARSPSSRSCARSSSGARGPRLRSPPPPSRRRRPPSVAPAPLALPDEPTVLIFGDSWTYGSAATVPTLGYAYVLGEAERLGHGRRRGARQRLPQARDRRRQLRRAHRRARPDLDPDLVIVEGSINDRRLYPAGYRDAVTAAWDALAALYPEASIVILGPAPQVLPVEAATARIDADLAELAAARGWWYVSPIGEDWITPANYARSSTRPRSAATTPRPTATPTSRGASPTRSMR